MDYALIFRWQVYVGRESEFRAAWSEATRLITEDGGSRGACLHEGTDGQFWSYARWPSAAARDRWRQASAEHRCFQLMAACIETRFAPVELMVRDDQLRLKKPGNRYDILTTDRLLLRPLVEADADSLHQALSDHEYMRYWSGVTETLDETRRYLRYNIDPDGADCFAIARKALPGVALGWVILIDRRPATAELGYLLVPSAQGAGLAREAVACALDYGFTTRGYRRIYADTDPENDRSIALLEALDFRFEGRHQATWETHIGIRDSAIYAVINPQI